MCDDLTRQDEDVELARSGLTRRQFAAVSTATAMAGFAIPAAAAGTLTESIVRVPTADGTADAFFVHPARGRSPAVIMWPDIWGLREAFHAAARRLAASGYAVLAVNQFYRDAPAPIYATLEEQRAPTAREKLAPMLPKLTPAAISRDAAAFVSFLDGQASVNKRRGMGVMGYCQGGNFAVRTAGAVPARIRGVASFHGGGLVSDQPDSPHLTLAVSRASYLIAVAQNDDTRSPQDKETFRAAAAAAGRPAEIEVYPANHGWCAADSASYNKEQSDRAWARMLVLFARL